MEKTEKDISIWLATTEPTNFPSLDHDISVDVAIVGAGITGITTAYLLKKAGLTVALIDKKRVVEKTTGNTTAKVTSLHTLKYAKLLKEIPEEMARLYGEANQAAIDIIENIIIENNIVCDFLRTPSYTYAATKDAVKDIEAEVEAAKKLGLPASFVDEAPLPFKTYGAIRFDNQAQFHPRKYLLALVKQITGGGSYVFENTKAETIAEADLAVIAGGNAITANWIVQASHKPFYDPDSFYKEHLSVYTDYALGVRMEEPTPEGMFISTDGTFSLRNQADDGEDILIIGGEGEEGEEEEFDENTLKHYAKLEETIRSKFKLQEIRYRWFTYDFGAKDGIPYIGPLSESAPHIWVATGFGGWGMTTSTVAAQIITDEILGNGNRWKEVFNAASPFRK